MQAPERCRQWRRWSGEAGTQQAPAWHSALQLKQGALWRLRGRCQMSRQCSMSLQSGALCRDFRRWGLCS